jgi:hypothetical protein
VCLKKFDVLKSKLILSAFMYFVSSGFFIANAEDMNWRGYSETGVGPSIPVAGILEWVCPTSTAATKEACIKLAKLQLGSLGCVWDENSLKQQEFGEVTCTIRNGRWNCGSARVNNCSAAGVSADGKTFSSKGSPNCKVYAQSVYKKNSTGNSTFPGICYWPEMKKPASVGPGGSVDAADAR